MSGRIGCPEYQLQAARRTRNVTWDDIEGMLRQRNRHVQVPLRCHRQRGVPCINGKEKEV